MKQAVEYKKMSELLSFRQFETDELVERWNGDDDEDEPLNRHQRGNALASLSEFYFKLRN